MAFGDHLSAAFLLGIPGRVADNNHAAGSDASESFAQSSFIVFGVMKRGIEDDRIELAILKRQLREFRLEPWEEPGQMLPIVLGGPKPVPVVDEQVDRERMESSKRQAKAHPAISRAKVQNSSEPSLKMRLQHMHQQG